ncbi:MAG: LysR family transcriptional regulator [Nannocystaceae bacterium]
MGARTLDLEAVAILCAVDRERSVSAAAAACGVPRSTAWRKLEQLEAAMACRLVERSARHLRLTAAGVALVARGRALLQDAEAAVVETQRAAEPQGGVIKLGMPPGAAPELLLAALTPFTRMEEGPAFHVFESAGALHPLKDDFDLIVTLNAPEDGDLYVRVLGTADWRCKASPAYLEGRPPVREPADLHAHRLLSFYVPPRSPTRWALRGGGSLRVRPILAITNTETVVHATHAGLGIGYAPWDFASRADELVDVLPDLLGEEISIYIVAGQRGRDSARVRLVQEAFERLRASGFFLG